MKELKTSAGPDSAPFSFIGRLGHSRKSRGAAKAVVWWLYFRWLKAYGKSLLKAHADNRAILANILLDEFLTTYGDKEPGFRVHLAFSVTDRLLPTEPIDHTRLPETQRKTLEEAEVFEIEYELFINYEKSRFVNDTRVRRIRTNHLRLQSFSRRVFQNQAKADEYFVKAQEIDPQVAPLTYKSFPRLSRELKKERRARTKAHRGRIREQAEEKKNTSTLVFEFSFHDAKAVFGVASVLFLCGGYIYNRLLLGHFGVDVARFFQINDYLATSLDKISITGLTVIVNIILAFLYWSPSYLAARKRMSNRRLFFEDFPFYMTAVLLPLALVSSFYLDLPGKYSMLLLLLMIITSKWVFRLSQHFKNRQLGYIIITYVSLFFGLLFARAFEDREQIAKKAESAAIRYHTSLQADIQVPTEGLYLIASNSRYYFFFSRELRKTYVMPKKNVSLIEIEDAPQESIFERLYKLMHPVTK